MADTIRFLPSELEVIIITETDGTGKPLPGGSRWVSCCDINNIEFENDQDDRERYTLENANRRCRISTTRQANLYGIIVRLAFNGENAIADHLLLGGRLNVDSIGDIKGAGTGKTSCKYVSIQIVAKGLGEECVAEAGGRAWRIFGKVGNWGKTQGVGLSADNSVGQTVYEGVAEFAPGYEDFPGDEWLTEPAQYSPEDEFSSWTTIDWEVPDCTDELIPIPGGSSPVN